jgi:hypothetical protein
MDYTQASSDFMAFRMLLLGLLQGRYVYTTPLVESLMSASALHEAKTKHASTGKHAFRGGKNTCYAYALCILLFQPFDNGGINGK